MSHPTLAANLLSIQPLTDASGHHAFTDLIYFAEQFYCAYRSADNHMGYGGHLVLLRSADGEVWHSLAQLEWAGGDLRDPKFFVNQAGQLCLMAGCRWAVPSVWDARVMSLTWVLSNHQPPQLINQQAKTWRWSACELGGAGLFSVAYSGGDKQGVLYQTQLGESWQAKVEAFFPSQSDLDASCDSPCDSLCINNEASLAYDSATQRAYCLLRRDGKGCVAALGQAVAPFTDWQWQNLDDYVGGPKLMFVTDSAGQKRLLACYRQFEFAERLQALIAEEADLSQLDDDELESMIAIQTVLAEIDLEQSVLVPILTLPSSGDCSYPGMVWHQERLWVSYYSSHQNEQTQVYLAQIELGLTI